MKKGIIIAIAVIAVLGVGVFLFIQDAKHPENRNPYANKSSRDLAGLCLAQEQLVMHIHPHLTITIDGQQQMIPPNIGIVGVGGSDPTTHDQARSQANCLHFIHTHDATGIIHVESPIPIDYRLSDFFYVWGKVFTKDQILDSKADATHRIRMTVNGTENTEYENLVINDEDDIHIFYETIQ